MLNQFKVGGKDEGFRIVRAILILVQRGSKEFLNLNLLSWFVKTYIHNENDKM